MESVQPKDAINLLSKEKKQELLVYYTPKLANLGTIAISMEFTPGINHQEGNFRETQTNDSIVH